MNCCVSGCVGGCARTGAGMGSEDKRQFREGTAQEAFYKEQHKKQTYEYALEKRGFFAGRTYKMWEVLEMMDDFVDPSDPDLEELPNSLHAYQAAEMARKLMPMDYQMQIVALIHDLGKILFKFGFPNWSIVGDTYVLGCDFPRGGKDSIVYRESLDQCPDVGVEKYGGKCGVYSEGCGLSELVLAYGHDEYLYQVLVRNRTRHKLTERYMNIIRFHSFYPWHSGGEYMWFMSGEDGKGGNGGKSGDKQILKDVKQFNKFDLYSKSDLLEDREVGEATRLYYRSLLKLFFPYHLTF